MKNELTTVVIVCKRILLTITPWKSHRITIVIWSMKKRNGSKKQRENKLEEKRILDKKKLKEIERKEKNEADWIIESYSRNKEKWERNKWK